MFDHVAAANHGVLFLNTLLLMVVAFRPFATSVLASGFSAAATENGLAFNTPAQFTYTLSGHFHGKSANGTERVGGQLREDITFNDGTAYSCITNTLPWSALGP